MSHSPKYVPVEAFMSPMQPIQAGKTGVPEVITAGGVMSSAAKVLFSTNFAAGDSITFGAVTLTAVAASPTAVQFVPAGTLALSLAALVTQFQAIAQVTSGAYSVTDVSTSITYTPGYGYTTGFVVSAVKPSGGTNAATQSGNLGVPLSYASLDLEHTQFNTALTFDVYLNDGDESQRKTFAMFGAGTVNLKGAHLPGATVNFALNGPDALVLQYLGGRWRLILSDGAVAS